MQKSIIVAALVASVMGLGGCTAFGIENVDMNNSVPVFETKKRVIDGIIYTRTEYTDGSVEYSAHNSPPKGYTGAWTANPNYQGTTIYVGPKGTRRTIEAQGGAPDPTDPKLWEEPQVITVPSQPEPVNTTPRGPTASTLPPRGEGGGDGGGGGGGSGGSGH